MRTQCCTVDTQEHSVWLIRAGSCCTVRNRSWPLCSWYFSPVHTGGKGSQRVPDEPAAGLHYCSWSGVSFCCSLTSRLAYQQFSWEKNLRLRSRLLATGKRYGERCLNVNRLVSIPQNCPSKACNCPTLLCEYLMLIPALYSFLRIYSICSIYKMTFRPLSPKAVLKIGTNHSTSMVQWRQCPANKMQPQQLLIQTAGSQLD